MTASNAVNPYRSRKPVTTPERFFGRDGLMDDVFSELVNSQSVSLIGERKLGKSSLLYQLLHRQPPNAVWALVNCESAEVNSNPSAFYRAVYNELLNTSQAGQGQGRELTQQDFNTALRESLPARQKIVLLLDNFDKIFQKPEFKQPVVDNLRFLASESQSHDFTLLISSRDLNIPTEIKDSPLVNITTHHYLDLLEREAAERMIDEPSSNNGVSFQDWERDWILSLAGTFPYFLNTLLDYAFRCKRRSGGAICAGRAMDRRELDHRSLATAWLLLDQSGSVTAILPGGLCPGTNTKGCREGTKKPSASGAHRQRRATV